MHEQGKQARNKCARSSAAPCAQGRAPLLHGARHISLAEGAGGASHQICLQNKQRKCNETLWILTSFYM